MTDEFIPYGRQSIDEEDIAAVVEVLQSDWLTTGPTVEQFERIISERVGGHVIALSSGTAALHAAFSAVGVGPGTEIITSPLTFAATATAALHLGADVVFTDVDDRTLLLDPLKAAAAVTERTRAIVPVDYAGQPADMDSFRSLTQSRGISLVEDAAHSIGSKYKGRPVGSLADLTTYSFHPVKTITTAEGGAVASPGSEYVAPIQRFRNHGLVREQHLLEEPKEGPWHQEVQSLGLNYRLPDVLAALGVSQLRRLDEFIDRRSQLADRYRTHLGSVEHIRLQEVRADVEPAWHLFVIRVPSHTRTDIFEMLRRDGIGVQVHYLPVYRHPLFKAMGRDYACPIAERAYEELLTLPLYPALTEKEQDRVIGKLIGYFS